MFYLEVAALEDVLEESVYALGTDARTILVQIRKCARGHDGPSWLWKPDHAVNSGASAWHRRLPCNAVRASASNPDCSGTSLITCNRNAVTVRRPCRAGYNRGEHSIRSTCEHPTMLC